METATSATLDFIGAINQHDIQRLDLIMADNHVFIGPYGDPVTNRSKVLEGWAKYFETFPDFRIEITEIFSIPGGAMGHGWSSGASMAAVDLKRSFRIPLAFRSKASRNRVELWQVFSDTMLPAEIISNPVFSADPQNTVEGFGGISIQARNPSHLIDWYDQNLGTQFNGNWDQHFKWRLYDYPQVTGTTEFSIYPENSPIYQPGHKPFMITFRVRSIDAILHHLKSQGVPQIGAVEHLESGSYAWILDPEGNKVELWQPKDEVILNNLDKTIASSL